MYGKNRDYCSYSALMLWKTNPDQYRKQYYENLPKVSSIYTRFGKQIHEQLEKNHEFFPEIDRTGLREQQIETVIKGVKVKAFIDYIDLRTPLIRDYKTSISRWTPVKVQSHEQLPFYSLLVENEMGLTIRNTDILWFETAKKADVIKKGGVKLIGETELFLTGYYEVIKRPHPVTAKERTRLKKWLIETADEIRFDYEKFQRAN